MDRFADQRKKKKQEDLVFFIRVQYRCNSSWQGTIQWMDGRKASVFRSVLELGKLIDDARKRIAEKSGEPLPVKSWEHKEDVS